MLILVAIIAFVLAPFVYVGCRLERFNLPNQPVYIAVILTCFGTTLLGAYFLYRSTLVHPSTLLSYVSTALTMFSAGLFYCFGPTRRARNS